MKGENLFSFSRHSPRASVITSPQPPNYQPTRSRQHERPLLCRGGRFTCTYHSTFCTRWGEREVWVRLKRAGLSRTWPLRQNKNTCARIPTSYASSPRRITNAKILIKKQSPQSVFYSTKHVIQKFTCRNKLFFIRNNYFKRE